MVDGGESVDVLGSRAWLRALVEGAAFRNTILVLIGINAVILGLETSPTVMDMAGETLIFVDHVILAVFVVELALRFYAHGPRLARDPWSVFDVVVVAIALVPATDSFSALRALRVLRVLRIISGVPRLRRVVGALLHAVPGIGAIGMLLVLVFYVFAVIATNLFGPRFPQWFGTIGESMYSLFQIMTLESWSMGIVRPVMEIHPGAWAFFVPFIIIATFTVLNLFIAIIVDSMQTLGASQGDRTAAKVADVVHEDSHALAEEIGRLRAEIRELKVLMESRRGDRVASP